MALTAEEKKIWTDALRSGNYKQTKGTLHNLDDGGFDPLGLGALVLGFASKEHMGVSGCEYDEDGDLPYDKQGPKDVYDWWRSKITSGSIQLLTKMNDRGDTFEEIADWIEEKL